MTLPDDRLNAILDSLYAEVPGRARLLEQHIEALTDEIGRVRAARLLHSATSGYVIVEAKPGDPDHELEVVDSTVWDDLAAAQETVGDDPNIYVQALMPLELFEPPCAHRRLRQITHALLQCEDCGAEMDS